MLYFEDEKWPFADPNNTLALTLVKYAKDTGEIPSAPGARASPDSLASCIRALLAGHPLPVRASARWTDGGTKSRDGPPGLLLCGGTGLYGVRRDARRHDR